MSHIPHVNNSARPIVNKPALCTHHKFKGLHSPVPAILDGAKQSLVALASVAVLCSNTAYASSLDLASAETLPLLPPLPSEFAPLPPLKLPKYKKFVLSNGLRVIVMEDHQAPLLRGTLLVKGGQRASPDDRLGVATLSSQLQREGGSVQHPDQSLDRALEDLAAAIEGGAGSDTLSLGFQCLKEDSNEVMQLFAEVLTSPALPKARLDVLKRQAINYLDHKNDNPNAIPARELAKLIYGKNSVYAREATQDSVERIEVEDIQSYLSTWIRPDNAVLGLIGDLSTSEMHKLAEQILGEKAAWPASTTTRLPIVPTPPLPDQDSIAGRVFVVDRPGATQTSIAVGEVGIQLGDPDQCSLDVLSGIFNSFGGRLFNDIRSRDGLAYSVGAGWITAPVDHPGLFLASAETAEPGQLLKALISAFNVAIDTAPSDSEVERAVEESKNSFVFNFSSPISQFGRIVQYELFGIPQDYPFQYRKCIDRVGAADVAAATKRRLHPKAQTVVAVGDGLKLKRELKELYSDKIHELKVDQDQ